MRKMAVFGILSTDAQAQRVAIKLKAAGFRGEDISVLFPDKSGTRDFAHEAHTKAPEGATTGAAALGILGAAAGWLVGIGTIAIPGVGPFIAAGPIMAALGGGAVGGAVGWIAGALIGMGIPELEAKQYESKIREGNIIVSVHTDDGMERDRVKTILKEEGAHDISTTGESSVRGDAHVA
jgi:hypothetical protein